MHCTFCLDQTITTSLLDARYICGDKEVNDVFEKKFRKKISKRSSKEFIDAKLEREKIDITRRDNQDI